MTRDNHHRGSPALPRRRLLAGTGAGALAAGSAPAPAIGQARRSWRMVTSWPKGAPGPGTTADRLAARITAMSDGALTVTVFGAGEIVPAFEVIDAVGGGVAELGHTASFFWTGKMPASVFFTAVPWGMTPESHNAWIRFGGGQALWDELYASFGVKPFLAGNSGVQMGGWYTRPLDGLEALRGMKIRMPGLGGEVLRRLGATPVTLPPGEIFLALSTGAIDGAEFLGPWSDVSLGLDRAAPYYYWPGFHEPNGSAECLVNREAFEGLPDNLRAIVMSACAAENARGVAEADWFNAETLADLESAGRTRLRRFPDDILRASYRAGREVLAHLAETDELTGRIWRSYGRAQRRMLGWSRVARHAILHEELDLRG